MGKTIKRIMAFATAMVMVLAMGIMSNAATITIQNKNNGNVNVANHMFSAYQIFSGTISNDGKKLTNIVWGTGVNSDGLLNALKTEAAFDGKFADATTAEDVAKKLTDSDMVAFSRIVNNYLTTPEKENVPGGTIEGLRDGYYFVKDVTTNLGDGDALSAFVVQLVGSATVTIKTDAPQIEKKLKNEEEPVEAYRDANNVGIGDVVDYRITSAVPDISNYKQYYFIVHDTLSAGLTFNDDIAIKVGERLLAAGTDYTVEKEGETNIEIVFKNFMQYKEAIGDSIEITYTATLNNKAAVGVEGNPNEVYLEYSNNPNKEGEGEDKPGPNDDDVTGQTPVDVVITYSTDLKVKKVDENEMPLAGVKFTISGYAQNDKITYTQVFEEDPQGIYWKLSDGTYTTIAPETLTASKYDSTETKYSLTVKKGEETETVTYEPKQITTGADGIIDIGALIAKGSLPAGTYVIHENNTADGYNVLDHDIVVKVSAKVDQVSDVDFKDPQKNTRVSWVVDSLSGEGATVNNGTIEIQIVNRSGATLPSTGGMGTTIFYIIGGVLVLAAAIVLISKRRVQQ